MNVKSNPVLDKSFEFSVSILKFSEILQKNKQYVLSNQLVRSCTSIGANCREAQNAESKNDFIHKFKIAAKEIEESEYWLLLCKELGYTKDSEILLSQLIEIKKIVCSIITTTKRKN